mgnify:CR=1 FL=1
MSVWKCPVCGSFMQHRGRAWSCSQGHSFDMAKSGYVNLLPANRKHAKNPGDNAVMMRARKRFLDAGHYAPLLQALEQSEIDVAFAILNPSEPAVGQVHSLPLLQSEICAAVHVDNPLARRDAIELEQLADQTLITPNQDFNLSGIILSHLSSLGISCQVQNICSQIDSCLALVNKNMGISFCSRASADYYRYPNVVSVSIKPAISRTVYLVYKKDLAFYPSLQHFVRFAAEFWKTNVIL